MQCTIKLTFVTQLQEVLHNRNPRALFDLYEAGFASPGFTGGKVKFKEGQPYAQDLPMEENHWWPWPPDQIPRLALFAQHNFHWSTQVWESNTQNISLSICFHGKEVFVCFQLQVRQTSCLSLVLSQEQQSQVGDSTCTQGRGLLTQVCLREQAFPLPRLHEEVLSESSPRWWMLLIQQTVSIT